MLDLSQTKLADALGLAFQQVLKYEKGANRIGGSRLQHISQIWCSQRPSSKEYRRRGTSTMHKPTPRLHNTYQTISPRPTGSISPKLSCRFQTQSFDVRSSIWWSRSPAPRISNLRGPEISGAAPHLPCHHHLHTIILGIPLWVHQDLLSVKNK
jgi:transcriptional regulator with XRE-family HTH domain